jgi:hypothetical protein
MDRGAALRLLDIVTAQRGYDRGQSGARGDGLPRLTHFSIGATAGAWRFGTHGCRGRLDYVARLGGVPYATNFGRRTLVRFPHQREAFGLGHRKGGALYKFDTRHRVSTPQTTPCNPFSPRSGRRHLAHGDSRGMRMSVTDPFSPVGAASGQHLGAAARHRRAALGRAGCRPYRGSPWSRPLSFPTAVAVG